MKKILIGMITISLVIFFMLPIILKSFGLHPDLPHKDFPNLSGKKALIIATNHGVLNRPNEKNGKPTGLFLSELSVPYYNFLKSNMTVDIASIKGGIIPIEPVPWFIDAPEDKLFKADSKNMDYLNNSLSIDEIDFKSYDIIFLSGGWGAAYDLGFSDTLGEKISDAYNAGSLFGAVCHGVLGFIRAKDDNGNLLIKGRKMTGVTNKQLDELGIKFTPQHPEDELKKAGVEFLSTSKFKDIFATLTVVDDEKKFVTGQNQNSGQMTSYKLLELLSEKYD